MNDRAARIVNVLAEDNYAWALRDPTTTAMKLTLMQEGAFVWLRGTADLFWRDLMVPGTERATTRFGSPAAGRVLLTGDPHPENIGTFQASDGTMVVDFDDFDTAAYGPYEGDVRRLAAGMIIAGSGAADADDIARQVALGYAAQMAELAAGSAVQPIVIGDEPYLDDLMTKAQKKGGEDADLDELAPVTDGVREMAFGDIDPIDAEGVISKRLEPVGAEAAVWIDQAVDQWRAGLPANIAATTGAVKLRARRYGQGVSSYAALRYDIVLEGPTPSPDDDVMIELKEEMDGVLLRGVPQLDFGAWDTEAARVCDAQLRMQARRDFDLLLGPTNVAPLSLRVHAETAYQNGVSSSDLAALPADQLTALAYRFGEMLARAHGQALTADGVPGWTVIEPLIGGGGDNGSAFADEVDAFATADAAGIVADWQLMKDVDLPALVLPEVQQ